MVLAMSTNCQSFDIICIIQQIQNKIQNLDLKLMAMMILRRGKIKEIFAANTIDKRLPFKADKNEMN